MFTFASNGLAATAAFTSLVIFILGTAVIVRGRSLIDSLFFVVTTVISGWCGAFAMMYGATTPDHALTWARLGNFASACVAPAIFHFAAVVVGRSRALRYQIVTAWAGCF